MQLDGLRVLGERILEVNRELHIFFVDFKDGILIKEIYTKQKVVVRVHEDEAEEMGIGGGFRQGCCLTPTLFKQRGPKKRNCNGRGKNKGQAAMAESDKEL